MTNTTLTQFPAGQTQYKINFDYLARPFVVVTLVNSKDSTKNRVLNVGTDYGFLNQTTIEIYTSQDGFDILQIHRFTSSDLIVGFRDGSVLTANDLTNAELQAIHIAEEGRDQSVSLASIYATEARNSASEAAGFLESIKENSFNFYIPIGTFEGPEVIVNAPNEVVRFGSGDSTTHWRWDGPYPKTVPIESSPEASGGIGNGLWVDVTDATLRSDLMSTSGSSMVKTSGGYTIQEHIDITDGNIYYHAPRPNGVRGVIRHSGNNLVFGSSDAEAAKLSPDDIVYFRMPQIARLPNGVIVILCNELHGNPTDIGSTPDQQCNIVMKMSTDNGWSWSSKITIANFGPTYQNGEISLTYNHVQGRLYAYFTSCKGKLGWGYSRPGNSEDTSSQIYVTYCDSEAPTIWRTPVNITSKLKPSTADFIWTSPTKGLTLSNGNMVMIISTVTGSTVRSYFTTINFDILLSMQLVLTNPVSGGEVGLNFTEDGRIVLNSRSYRTDDRKGLQTFFVSDRTFTVWKQVSTLVTSDSKGDLVRLFDGVNGAPLWAFTCANGVGDNSIGRTNYRVWLSKDLVTWGLSPVGGINTSDSVGYIASTNGGRDGYVISTSESGGFQGIWFTQWSSPFIQGRNYARYADAVPTIESADEGKILSSGSIRNFEMYTVRNESRLKVNVRGTPYSITMSPSAAEPYYRRASTEAAGVIPADGLIGVIMEGVGTLTISGFSGGYDGQTITVMSYARGGKVNCLLAASGIAPSNRLVYGVSTGLTSLNLEYGTNLISCRFTKTPSGWISDVSANV